MMAVGNVQIRNLRKLGFDEPDFFRTGNGPRGVAHAILGGEINGGCFGSFAGDKSIQLFGRAIGQKHRAGLGIQGFNVAHAVVFFVGPGEFVLLDDVGQIFLAARRRHQPHLGMTAHDLTVEIKRRLGILLKRRLADQFLKVFQAFGVNGRGIQINARGQINLRLADMQKA